MYYFPAITSRENPKLKTARAVRDGKEKSAVFVEGIRLTEEVLRSGLIIKIVFILDKILLNPRASNLLQNIVRQNYPVFRLDENLFKSISDTENSQGIIVLAEKPEIGREQIEANISQSPLLLLLHQLNNPANLGAILRTAEAAGVDGVITTKGTTDIFSPKTTRSAMGANFRLPLWTNTEFVEVVNWAQEKQINTFCSDVRSDISYLRIDWRAAGLLVIGSEGHGLTVAERSLTKQSLIIPMANDVESLNAAVACGIILFEAKRQRENI